MMPGVGGSSPLIRPIFLFKNNELLLYANFIMLACERLCEWGQKVHKLFQQLRLILISEILLDSQKSGVFNCETQDHRLTMPGVANSIYESTSLGDHVSETRDQKFIP